MVEARVRCVLNRWVPQVRGRAPPDGTSPSCPAVGLPAGVLVGALRLWTDFTPPPVGQRDSEGSSSHTRATPPE